MVQSGLSFVVQSTWLLLSGYPSLIMRFGCELWSKGHSAPFVGCARQRPLRCHLKQLPRYSSLISTSSLGLCLCVCHPKTCPNPPLPIFPIGTSLQGSQRAIKLETATAGVRWPPEDAENHLERNIRILMFKVIKVILFCAQLACAL